MKRYYPGTLIIASFGANKVMGCITECFKEYKDIYEVFWLDEQFFGIGLMDKSHEVIE